MINFRYCISRRFLFQIFVRLKWRHRVEVRVCATHGRRAVDSRELMRIRVTYLHVLCYIGPLHRDTLKKFLSKVDSSGPA
jgi:hypothetical protein